MGDGPPRGPRGRWMTSAGAGLRLVLAVLALLCAGAPPPVGAGRGGLGDEPPDGAAQYVVICGAYGDFSNQLLTVAKAYGLASALNRTLVLPPIKRTAFFELFDRATLQAGPVPVVPLAAYRPRFASEGCLFRVRSLNCPCYHMVPPLRRAKVRTLFVHAKDLFIDALDLRLYDPTGPIRFGLRLRRPACIFRHLAPQPALAAELARFAAQRLPPAYLAVHLRYAHYGAVHQCRRMGQTYGKLLLEGTGGRLDWRPTGMECSLPLKYLAIFRPPNDTTPFFLATDGTNPRRTQMLERVGAVRFRPMSPALAVAAIRAVADQFLLARGATFLGNPFSSFSGFACDLRRARGLLCPNMPPEYKPCISYPDHFITPRVIVAQSRALSSTASLDSDRFRT